MKFLVFSISRSKVPHWELMLRVFTGPWSLIRIESGKLMGALRHELRLYIAGKLFYYNWSLSIRLWRKRI